MGRSATAPHGAAAAVLVLTALLHRMGRVHGEHGDTSLAHFALETDTRPAFPYQADFLEVTTEQLPSDCGDRSVP